MFVLFFGNLAMLFYCDVYKGISGAVQRLTGRIALCASLYIWVMVTTLCKLLICGSNEVFKTCTVTEEGECVSICVCKLRVSSALLYEDCSSLQHAQ